MVYIPLIELSVVWGLSIVNSTPGEIEQILRWKSRGQYGRQQASRATGTGQLVQAVTRLALTIVHSAVEYVLEVRLGILGALQAVAATVASNSNGLLVGGPSPHGEAGAGSPLGPENREDAPRGILTHAHCPICAIRCQTLPVPRR